MARAIRPERTVVLNTKELLNKMRENRAEHIRIYEEALEGYRTKCVSVLEKRLADAKQGEVNLRFDLVRPTSYKEQYDTIIEMLEWSTDPTIEVTMGEFNAWVRDRWDWQHGFLSSNSAYSSRAVKKSMSL